MTVQSHAPLPHSRHAEQGLLGALLRDNAALYDAAAVLAGTEDFYSFGHQKIFEAITDLCRSQKIADIVTVDAWLKDREFLEEAGGHGYLVELWNEAVTPSAARYYAEIVRDKALLRRLQGAVLEINDEMKHQGRPVEEIIAAAERKILSIGQVGAVGTTHSLAQAVDEYLVELDRRIGPDGVLRMAGIETPWPDLDRLIGGLHAQKLIVIAARTSVGKSMMAGNIALLFGQRQKPVFVSTVETTRTEWVERLACCLGEVDSVLLRYGGLSGTDRERFNRATDELVRMPIEIDDAGDQTVARIVANARRLRMRGKADLVIVDYLQRLSGGERRRRDERRDQEIGNMTRQLRGLAQELDIPVLVLAQLGRDAEGRRPKLSDLRESGDIEQDADVVIFLHRENAPDPVINVLDVIVAKHRQGPIGDLKLEHHVRFFKLKSLAPPAVSSRWQ